MKRLLGILTAVVMLMTFCFGATAFAESPAGPFLTLEAIQALNNNDVVIDINE